MWRRAGLLETDGTHTRKPGHMGTPSLDDPAVLRTAAVPSLPACYPDWATQPPLLLSLDPPMCGDWYGAFISFLDVFLTVGAVVLSSGVG